MDRGRLYRSKTQKIYLLNAYRSELDDDVAKELFDLPPKFWFLKFWVQVNPSIM